VCPSRHHKAGYGQLSPRFARRALSSPPPQKNRHSNASQQFHHTTTCTSQHHSTITCYITRTDRPDGSRVTRHLENLFSRTPSRKPVF
jgi:hypothetical protein